MLFDGVRPRTAIISVLAFVVYDEGVHHAYDA